MRNQWIAILLALSMWTGCSEIQTSQDYAPDTNFTRMGTISWESETQPQTGDERIDNPFRDTRIRDAIQGQLTAKGFVFKEDPPTDINVRYQYVLRQRIDASGTRGSVGIGIGSFGRGGGIAIGTGNDVQQVDDGTLVIDLLSGESGELLWRGSGTERFKAYKDPNNAVKDINTLVEAVLKQFPPTD